VTAYGGKDQLRPDKRGKVQHLETREQESRWLGATCSCARVSDRSSEQKLDREGRSETGASKINFCGSWHEQILETQEMARLEEKSSNLNHVAGKQLGKENQYESPQSIKNEFSIEYFNTNTIDPRSSSHSLSHLIET
jgi:hypothetical protein